MDAVDRAHARHLDGSLTWLESAVINVGAVFALPLRIPKRRAMKTGPAMCRPG